MSESESEKKSKPLDKMTLEELLKESSKENFALSEEDKEWLNEKPKGREIIK